MLHGLLTHIERYLNARCTLQDLEAWLLSNLQGILDSGDDSAIEVANQVDADFAELSEGLIDEATLRERLENYVRVKETSFFSFETEPSATTHATAAVETIIRSQLEVPGPVVDLRLGRLEFA